MAYIATIKVLVDETNEAAVYDGINNLLMEAQMGGPNGEDRGWIVDWKIKSVDPTNKSFDDLIANETAEGEIQASSAFNLLVEAFALEDDDAPLWALIQVSPSFLKELKDKAKLVAAHDLITVMSRLTVPVEWESGSDLRIRGGSVLITENGFQIESFPKHAGYPVYTLEIGTSTLEKLARGEMLDGGVATRKLADGLYAIASDEAMLDAIVEDYQAYTEV